MRSNPGKIWITYKAGWTHMTWTKCDPVVQDDKTQFNPDVNYYNMHSYHNNSSCGLCPPLLSDYIIVYYIGRLRLKSIMEFMLLSCYSQCNMVTICVKSSTLGKNQKILFFVNILLAVCYYFCLLLVRELFRWLLRRNF